VGSGDGWREGGGGGGGGGGLTRRQPAVIGAYPAGRDAAVAVADWLARRACRLEHPLREPTRQRAPHRERHILAGEPKRAKLVVGAHRAVPEWAGGRADENTDKIGRFILGCVCRCMAMAGRLWALCVTVCVYSSCGGVEEQQACGSGGRRRTGTPPTQHDGKGKVKRGIDRPDLGP